MLRYHNITKDDMLNGDGLRTVLWLSGCEHFCVGCQNPITWNIDNGVIFDKKAKRELFHSLMPDYIDGLTISGGDPLHPNNISDVTELIKEIKELLPSKTIWIYTGYLYEQVKDLELINYIDVLIDGKFIRELADPKLEWRGSSNQRIINIKEKKQIKK